MSVRIVLVDDQLVVRAGFRALLDLTDDLEVVGEAADGREALDTVRRHRPDVVLMDIRMPVMDGIEATRRVTSDAELAGVRIIALTTFDADAHVVDVLRAGASGFLLKDVDADGLVTAVRTVADGQAFLSPAVTQVVLDEVVVRAPAAPHRPERLAALTDREREVMRLAAAGLSNQEIGAALLMSPLTAKTHVSRAMTKLGVRDRVQLVVLAYETGLARAEDRTRWGPGAGG